MQNENMLLRKGVRRPSVCPPGRALIQSQPAIEEKHSHYQNMANLRQWGILIPRLAQWILMHSFSKQTKITRHSKGHFKEKESIEKNPTLPDGKGT